MKETIKDLRIRYVFSPKEPLPKVIERGSYMAGYNAGKNAGWNAAVAYYKAVGKI
jgi:hypothetical protein